MKTQITGVVGGSVGRDPFDAGTWSGSCLLLFEALRQRGRLSRAFGADISRTRRWSLLAKNFSPSRRTWRIQYYFDRAYREALTQRVRHLIAEADHDNVFLQIGAEFSVPDAIGGRGRCVSYHDSNIAEYVQSKYASKDVSPRRIAEAFEYESRFYRSVDKVLAMSEYHRQSFIRNFSVPPDRAVNVGCAVNLTAFPEYIEGKRYDDQECLFVGIDFERKGGTDLLRAFKIVRETFPGARLHLVGPPKLAIPHDLTNGVVFHGFLNKRIEPERKKLEDLYRRCCLFVLPSYYEGVGVSSLEAMLYQMPCIVTNGWGFTDTTIPDKTGYLVECGKIEDLVDKLVKALSDPAKLRYMGEKGRCMVMESFTWNAVAKRVEDAICG
jgi:glycosyltransferase involved in cell wall biosynthesis